MRRVEDHFATESALRTARHLGSLVRTARLARGWSQLELAERAKVSAPTMSRMEKGGVASSLGAWLAVFEALGLLRLLDQVDDPASRALVDATRIQRSSRTAPRDDLDF